MLTDLQAIFLRLLQAAADARIRAQYHPTLEKQQMEIARAERIEKHADSIFSRLY